jgi:hypothetical protein
MRAMVLAAVGLTLLLAPAGARAQAFVQGNDTGGIISWSCENEVASPQLAAAHCAAYGKYPRITSVTRQYGDYIGFNCLWHPHINRFAIPAVPVRSACHAYAVKPQRLWPRVRVRY